MNFNKKEYLKNNKFLKDAEVVEDRKDEEVSERALRITVANAETGEIRDEFETSCCFVFGVNKNKPDEIHNFCFTAAPIKHITRLLRSVKAGVEMLVKSDPVILTAMYMEEIFAESHDEEEEE